MLCQEKEIYRWPVRESVKTILAMGWSVERTKEGEALALHRENEKMRSISQTSQVIFLFVCFTLFYYSIN